MGVENYHPPKDVHGIFCNPVCTEFSTVGGFDKASDTDKGMVLVNHCFRIIAMSNCKWWVMENPNRGRLKSVIGKPNHSYQPWQFGIPWTEDTALWGNFNMPKVTHPFLRDVKQIPELWIRSGRKIACLTYPHKSAINYMPEYDWCKDVILAEKSDMGIRSMCSDGLAKAFKLVNP